MKKIIIILILIGSLVFTVSQMMDYENSIRENHIITKYVEDDSKPLISNFSDEDIKDLTNHIYSKFKTGNQYFYKKTTINGKEDYTPIFIKGVNLGVAVPGKFPAEFSLNFDQYLSWFYKIGEMNANVIRVYTILPPEFYKALAYYNLHNQDKTLYLMHGVWAKVPKDEDYYNKAYTREFKKEIHDVIDVLHGKTALPIKPGKAHGIYNYDVSKYVIGYLLGREWEPRGVFKTIKEHTEHSYNGSFISLPYGNAMEVWLAKMMDFTVRYETQNYQNQHPISFVNWLPLSRHRNITTKGH